MLEKNFQRRAAKQKINGNFKIWNTVISSLKYTKL